MASSFNPKLAEICARVSAIEASTSGIHVTFSPMADLSRDPRWGRVVEGFGEDSYLIGEMVKGMVKGYIGSGMDKPGNLASCVKHFAGYGACEAGRDYNTVDLSRLSLYSQYLPAYKKALDAGSRLVMTSFNTIDGVPSTVNKFLLRDVLREKWKFNGVTISDYDSLKQIMAHGVAKDMEEVAYKGITGGLDIEMASSAYSNHLEDLISNGLVDIRLLDEAVLRVLDLKRDCGLFEDPYKGASAKLAKELILSKEHKLASLEVAHESMVLLKNDGVLPLSKTAKIALIGPYASSKATIGPWSWHGRRDLHESLEEVLKDQLLFCKSDVLVSNYSDTDFEKIASADVVILALGESEECSGEAHSKSNIVLPNNQELLLKMVEIYSKKTITLLFNGRPLLLQGLLSTNALLECWFLGSQSSLAIKDVLYGKINPSGKLPISFPRSVGQIPLYYNHLNTGRPYMGPNDHNVFVSKYLDVENTPLFPFGYGLSYANFEYNSLKINKSKMSDMDTIEAKVTVTNTSDIAGYEIVQLYIKDNFAMISRPILELKQFKKIWIEPNERKVVSFTITKDDLTYINAEGETVLEPGTFTLFVGKSSIQTISEHFEYIINK
jgi:beta-glucosidase